ncbi:hypothetical protein [Hymenobacter guriensis]|uniref:Lipoprotein n=1 Tax=Hymenobacter guriensis TaxID=2793065 RepID=A0ABS0L5P9_9BACT|nr:hypothetical protein [Hymenobacter guriensis]MBG8555488.1 hypothetical protein [Hymenobacter guriensis]
MKATVLIVCVTMMSCKVLTIEKQASVKAYAISMGKRTKFPIDSFSIENFSELNTVISVKHITEFHKKISELRITEGEFLYDFVRMKIMIGDANEKRESMLFDSKGQLLYRGRLYAYDKEVYVKIFKIIGLDSSVYLN